MKRVGPMVKGRVREVLVGLPRNSLKTILPKGRRQVPGEAPEGRPGGPGWRQDGFKGRPGRCQKQKKRLKGASRRAKSRPRAAQEPPKRRPVGAWEASGAEMDAGALLEGLFGPFWVACGAILIDCRLVFGTFFDEF